MTYNAVQKVGQAADGINYRIRCAAAPQDTEYEVWGSDDPDFGSYDTLDTGTIPSGETRHTGTIDTPDTYAWYRLVITGSGDTLELKSFGVAKAAEPGIELDADGSDVYQIPTGGTGGGGGGGGVSDPVADVFGTPDTAYEFDSSSLSGWTALGSPDVSDADTTYAGHYYLEDNATGIAIVGIHRAAPSTPFTAITHVRARLNANYNAAGILLGSSDPSGSRSALFQFGHSDGGEAARQVAAAKFNSASSFDASLGTHFNYFVDEVYLAVVVNSSTNVDAYWSIDGRLWHPFLAGVDPNLTLAKIGLAGTSVNSTAMKAAFEYLRLWNSALTFPGF